MTQDTLWKLTTAVPQVKSVILYGNYSMEHNLVLESQSEDSMDQYSVLMIARRIYGSILRTRL